jgi:hypothetical protein
MRVAMARLDFKENSWITIKLLEIYVRAVALASNKFWKQKAGMHKALY